MSYGMPRNPLGYAPFSSENITFTVVLCDDYETHFFIS